MTEKHYLVANKRLKKGEYGSNPFWVLAEEIDESELKNVYYRQMHEWKGQKYWLIYKTKNDCHGIAIERRRDLTIPHVTNKFIYELDCPDERLAYEALFRFVEEQLWYGDKIELYTCFDGEEDAARSTACELLFIWMPVYTYLEEHLFRLAMKIRWPIWLENSGGMIANML